MTRRLRATLILPMLLSWATARADFVYEDGIQIADRVGLMQRALRNSSALNYLSAYADAPDPTFYSNGNRSVGKAAIQPALTARIAARAGDTFTATNPRVWIDGSDAWCFFDYEWGAESGRQLVLLEQFAGNWSATGVDFDGDTLQAPPPTFNASQAVAEIGAVVETLRLASAALEPLNMDELEPLIDAPNFEFTDEGGKTWFAAEALLRMAFAAIPNSIGEDKMTLLMSNGTSRATAFQDVGGQRMSLALRRNTGRWQIVAASLSAELDTLAVSPKGRLVTTWASLRQR